MDGEGYIRMYWKTKRSLVGDNLVGLGLWTHILLSVAVKRRLLANGDVLEPGECIVSVAKLAELGEGLTRKRLTKYLTALEADGMIRVLKRNRNGTKVSVCNFRTYQPQFFATEQQRNSNGTEREQKGNRNVTQTENPKIPKSLNKGGASPRQPFEPPTVETVAAWVQEKSYTFDPEAFVAHYAARNWMFANGRKMASWKSACVTWQKNSRKFDNGTPPTTRLQPMDPAEQYLAEKRRNGQS